MNQRSRRIKNRTAAAACKAAPQKTSRSRPCRNVPATSAVDTAAAGLTGRNSSARNAEKTATQRQRKEEGKPVAGTLRHDDKAEAVALRRVEETDIAVHLAPQICRGATVKARSLRRRGTLVSCGRILDTAVFVAFCLSQASAGIERMAGEKLRRTHAPPAFALQYKNAQRSLTTTNDHARFVGAQNFAGRAGLRDDFRPPDFQELRTGCDGKWRERARPRRERADAIPNRPRRQVPVNAPVFFPDFRRERDAFSRLRPGLNFPAT